MTVTLSSTSRMVELDGVPARVWEGHTAAGVPIIAFVTRIAVETSADASELDAELVEQRAPSAAAAAWPSRMVL